MKAVILAGGRGKRLGALTQYRPKPMLLISGHPFLEYLLTWLKRYGLIDIIICSGYLSGLIEEYFGSGKDFGVNVKYVTEKRPLGTAGALRKASKYINGDFILINGDSFINVDLKDMIEYHYRNKNKITMAVTETNNFNRYGKVNIDNNGWIISFNEKSGKGKFINVGIYICHRELLNRLPHRYPSSLEKDVFPWLVKDWLCAYIVQGFFIDIGTLGDYTRLKSMKDKLPSL